MFDLRFRSTRRLLQSFAQDYARRQASQVLGDVDARLVQFQQLDLLVLLAGAAARLRPSPIVVVPNKLLFP